MITKKEETLQRCLEKTGLRKLPSTVQEGKVWIDGIALVKRINGQEDYVLVQNDGDNNPNVVQDFGPCVMIHTIETIYPVNTVDRKFVPDLRSNKAVTEFLVRYNYDKDEITALLDKEGKTADRIAADRAKIKNYITKTSIRIAKDSIAETNRCLEIHKYAEAKKNRIDYGEED